MKIIEVTPEETKQWKEFAKPCMPPSHIRICYPKIEQVRKEYYAGKKCQSFFKAIREIFQSFLQLLDKTTA